MLLARFRSPNHALAYVAALNAGGLVPTDLAGMVAAAEPKAPLLLRPVEAAERLEVSARVVRDLAAGLGLRLHRTAGGQRRYSLADVQRLEVAVQTWRQRTGRR